MRKLIDNRDLKTLFQGVAVVAAAGLLMGAAMQPDLDARAVQGPQMLASGGGPRSTVAPADPGAAAYRGKVPDYVLGTDWAKPPELEYPDDAPAAEDYVSEAATQEEPPTPARHALWREPPREPAVYPSMTGDTPYESELPPPPDPPDDSDAG